LTDEVRVVGLGCARNEELGRELLDDFSLTLDAGSIGEGLSSGEGPA